MAVDPVANLYVQLGMDVARLQGDVQKATTILDNFQRRVDRGGEVAVGDVAHTGPCHKAGGEYAVLV